MELSVTDSGRGIPEEQLEKIFLRYYQIDGHVEGKYNWGTGIGLYYARKLARLHHGDLKAEGKYNVSEVSDMTGFNSLAHFSKVFKKKFGVTPRDYKG